MLVPGGGTVKTGGMEIRLMLPRKGRSDVPKGVPGGGGKEGSSGGLSQKGCCQCLSDWENVGMREAPSGELGEAKEESIPQAHIHWELLPFGTFKGRRRESPFKV